VAATEVEAVSAVTAEAVAEAVVEVEEAILEVAEEEMVDSVETEVAAFEAIEVEAEVAVVEGVVHLVVQWRIRYSPTLLHKVPKSPRPKMLCIRLARRRSI